MTLIDLFLIPTCPFDWIGFLARTNRKTPTEKGLKKKEKYLQKYCYPRMKSTYYHPYVKIERVRNPKGAVLLVLGYGLPYDSYWTHKFREKFPNKNAIIVELPTGLISPTPQGSKIAADNVWEAIKKIMRKYKPDLAWGISSGTGFVLKAANEFKTIKKVWTFQIGVGYAMAMYYAQYDIINKKKYTEKDYEILSDYDPLTIVDHIKNLRHVNWVLFEGLGDALIMEGKKQWPPLRDEIERLKLKTVIHQIPFFGHLFCGLIGAILPKSFYELNEKNKSTH